jgi:osmotically inducible protein OsmC
MAIRTANAEWKGDLPSGTGSFNGESGELDGKYSFQSRFAEGGGTNPEELVGAAHASCFSMSLAHILSQGGTTPDSIRTEAKVQVLKDPDGEGFKIMKIDLATVGRVSGVDAAAFEQAAQEAKKGCPLSKALAAVPEINVSATLES